MPYAIPVAKQDTWRPIIDTPGFRRRMGRKYRSSGLQVYPGFMSDDPRFLRAMSDLAARLSNIPVNIDASGVLGPEAVPGDFRQLLTVAGHGMTPVSVPPVTNEPIREELHLLRDFATPRDREIFDGLVTAMFARTAPSSVPIRRAASTGAPDYMADMPKKKRELRAILGDVDTFLDMVHSGKLLDLFVEFNSPIVHTIGIRTQADKVTLENGRLISKPREVNDELAARSGFKEGRRFPADKRVFVDSNEVAGHFAGRRRTVYGTSFGPNYLMAAICAQWRAVYLEDFAFTWKHRTPDQILGKMRKYRAVVGFDVKQFDQTVPEFLIDAMVESIGRYTDPRVCSLIKLLFKAPYIVPYPWDEGRGEYDFDPLFGGDPFDVGCFDNLNGLPSGIAINPDTGKLMMMFQYLVALDRYHGDVLEVGIDVILRGEHSRYAALNMGDDCVLLVDDRNFAEWFRTSWKDANAAYFALEEERPISFLGNVPYRDDAGDLQLAPNVISFLVNWLVPEHGIDHASRVRFWAVGERERRVHYARAPMYPEVKNALEDAFQTHCSFSPSAVAEEAFSSQRRLMTLSTWDALVLQNPDYLHYRVDPSDISPEVLDIIVTSLTADEVWPHLKHLFDRRYTNE